MRVLVSTTAGSSHFGPLIPFCVACRDSGHEVRVAAPASFAGAVAEAGFEHAQFADVAPEVMGPIFGRLSDLSLEEANATVIGEIYGRLDAQAALPGVMAMIDRWRPDLVMREPTEFASLVAAERAGIAQVQVAIGMLGAFEAAWPILSEPLAELSVRAGLPADRAFATMVRTPELTCVPASLDEPLDGQRRDAFERGSRWRFRHASWRSEGGAMPPSWGDPQLPLVYVTFGSVTGSLEPFAAMYAATLAALADAPLRVLMTTGSATDPASLEPWPANAHVEQWWPQADVMAHAAAVLGHGGFGTTMMALAAGVPQVVVPLFAFDQTVNAERVAGVGAGIHLAGGPTAAAELPAAVTAAVSDPAYRAGAAAIAAEMAALPDTAAAVAVLERLAT
jgi:UDP:flavonoid glycosyltransferase YjiC (YdhE family)